MHSKVLMVKNLSGWKGAVHNRHLLVNYNFGPTWIALESQSCPFLKHPLPAAILRSPTKIISTKKCKFLSPIFFHLYHKKNGLDELASIILCAHLKNSDIIYGWAQTRISEENHTKCILRIVGVLSIVWGYLSKLCAKRVKKDL